MFCTKCGTNNPDNSKFCVGCGGQLGGNTENQSPVTQESKSPPIPKVEIPKIDIPEQQASGSGALHCPKCKSKKLQALMETNVKGGYRAGTGCIGFLLFGPLGFLCGAAGKKARISSTNTPWFVCMECGFRFIDVDLMKAYKQDEAKIWFIGIYVCAVLGIVLAGPGQGGVGAVLGGLFFAAVCIFAHIQLKKDIKDLEENGYDATCYLEKKEK